MPQSFVMGYRNSYKWIRLIHQGLFTANDAISTVKILWEKEKAGIKVLQNSFLIIDKENISIHLHTAQMF